MDKGEEPASVESLKGIIFVQYNSKDTSCKDFHAYLLSNKNSWEDQINMMAKEDEEEKTKDTKFF